MNTTQHELIAELKRIAADLGRVPTRDEYTKRSKFSVKAYAREFGAYAALVQAAGLRPLAKDRRKADTFFLADPATVVKPIEKASPKPITHALQKKILVIGDTHFPFVSVDGLCALYLFAEQNADITHIVQLGDLFDCYSFASFPKSMLQFTPKQELDLARQMAGDMWAKLRSICPQAECHQILGNHSTRPIKRLLEQSPELEIFFDYLKHWEFPGVTLHKDPREPLLIDGVHFMHGHFTKLGDHAKRYGVSVVCGHTHRGGVMPLRLADGRSVYELNAGYLGDPSAKALSYTATRLIDWTHGFALIDHLGPRFIQL